MIGTMHNTTYTTDQLRAKLNTYVDELRAAHLSERTIETYRDRADRFIRWLDGDYSPRVG